LGAIQNNRAAFFGDVVWLSTESEALFEDCRLEENPVNSVCSASSFMSTN
jgi:hypothetical protein